MDEEYLLINSDYQLRELSLNRNNIILTKYTATGRNDFPHIDYSKKSLPSDLNVSIHVKKNHQSQKDLLNSESKRVEKRDSSDDSSSKFKCFEHFNDTDENDINYLKGTYYVDTKKLYKGTNINSASNVKLLNSVLTHRKSLCSNNPRVKAISKCSSLLRHSMPTTRLITHSSRLKLTNNPKNSSSIIPDSDLQRQHITSKFHTNIHIFSKNQHSNLSTSLDTTTVKSDTYPALEDHRYYARHTPGSPPPVKRRSLMPQFKSSSASTINSPVTSFSNTTSANHINILQCKKHNSRHLNDTNVFNCNGTSSNLANINVMCRHNRNNNSNSCINNNNNNNSFTNHKNNNILSGSSTMSILETFLRATCPLDPSKGSTAALLATDGLLNLSIEAEDSGSTTTHSCNNTDNNSDNNTYNNSNLLKKLLTGDIDSEATSGIETCSSEIHSPFSHTPLSSLSPTSVLSPSSDSMESMYTLSIDSLLTDGFGLDADLTVDEKGGLDMQLDSEWHEDPFKMISHMGMSETWIKQECISHLPDCITQQL